MTSPDAPSSATPVAPTGPAASAARGSTALLPSTRTGRGTRDRPSPRPTRRQEIVARIITWTYAVGACWALVLWIVRYRTHGGMFSDTWVDIAFGLVGVPVDGSLLSFVVMLIATRVLVGRKRVGLVVVATFQVISLLFGVISIIGIATYDGPQVFDYTSARFVLGPGLAMLSTLPALVLCWVCWWVRPAFPGRLRPGSWLTLVGTAVVGIAASTLLTWGLLAAAAPGHPTLRVLRAIFTRSLGIQLPWERQLLLGVPGWIPQLYAVLLALTLLLAVVLFTRSAERAAGWSGDREVAVRRLLAQWGDLDSLGYFSTRRDKAAVFSPDGRAAICYDVVAGVSLASGDPVGDPAAWPEAIRVWKAEARRYGWIPAVLGASEDAARAYVAEGLNALVLGDEAILDPSHYRINNTSMTDVRRAVQRARRAGLTVQMRRQADIPPEELTQLVVLADAWREGEVERGFSMALDRVGDPSDERVLFVTAHEPDGAVKGLLTFVPWGQRGLSLDLMRRHPEAPNGTTELLVSELMAGAGEFGVQHVSLNFAFLRGVFADADRLGAGVLTRLNSSLLGIFDRFFQLERLYKANQKYGPTWRPRYICLDSRLSVPQVAIACGSAEGFLPRPGAKRSRERHLDPTQLAEVRAIDTTPALTWESLGPKRDDQTRVRIARLDQLRAAGREPYPVGLAPAQRVSELTPAYWDDPKPVRVSGRIQTVRNHGGVVFARLADGDRAVQLVLERDVIGAADLRLFATDIDSGDLVVVDAVPGRSRNGTPSLIVSEWQLAAKALHPVPWGAFNDPDARLRRRATSIIVHPEEATLLRLRSRVITSMRATLDGVGFLEVETPILQSVHGGASARPFTTFINAYGVDLFMRIAPELFLKRLVVAGLGPLYEIGRNFRNEGADATHNPEFTSMEAYQPFGDYTTMRLLTEELIKNAATAVHGSPKLPLHTGGADQPAELVDVSGEWPVVPVLEAVSKATGVDVGFDMDFEELLALARTHGIATRPEMGHGAIIEELYGELVEPATVFPTFYTDFPVETSPLAGGHRSNPHLAERWDLVANTMEIGTAYSELADPIEQRRRLTEQSLKAAAGDVEAMQVDEDFLRSLEMGMPPTGGLGIGVDRLVMLITDTNIRQVLTFPFAKPR